MPDEERLLYTEAELREIDGDQRGRLIKAAQILSQSDEFLSPQQVYWELIKAAIELDLNQFLNSEGYEDQDVAKGATAAHVSYIVSWILTNGLIVKDEDDE